MDKGGQQKFYPGGIASLLDHFVRSEQHVRRNREADLFGCFEIDDELELLRLLDWEITGLGAFQNLVRVCGRAAVLVSIAGRIRHQTPSVHSLWGAIHRWQPVLSRELDDTLQVHIDEGFGRGNQSLGMLP